MTRLLVHRVIQHPFRYTVQPVTQALTCALQPEKRIDMRIADRKKDRHCPSTRLQASSLYVDLVREVEVARQYVPTEHRRRAVLFDVHEVRHFPAIRMDGGD